jgi:hypothetical protein
MKKRKIPVPDGQWTSTDELVASHADIHTSSKSILSFWALYFSFSREKHDLPKTGWTCLTSWTPPSVQQADGALPACLISLQTHSRVVKFEIKSWLSNTETSYFEHGRQEETPINISRFYSDSHSNIRSRIRVVTLYLYITFSLKHKVSGNTTVSFSTS